MLPDDSSEPENNLDYSIYEYEVPWDDQDDAGAPPGPEAEAEGTNLYHANRPSLAQVILLPTGNLEDDAILPTAFRENSVVRLLYPQAVIILSFSGPYSFFPC